MTGLRLATKLGAKNLIIQSDSQLFVGQVKGEYEARGERMKRYLTLVQRVLKKLEKVEFRQVPREENVDADRLARLASSGEEAKGIIKV